MKREGQQEYSVYNMFLNVLRGQCSTAHPEEKTACTKALERERAGPVRGSRTVCVGRSSGLYNGENGLDQCFWGGLYRALVP